MFFFTFKKSILIWKKIEIRTEIINFFLTDFETEGHRKICEGEIEGNWIEEKEMEDMGAE